VATAIGARYQWLQESADAGGLVPLAGRTNAEFIPQADGRFSVQVTDENGCQALSEALEFKRVSGFATLEVGSASAPQGGVVEVPISLGANRNLAETGATGFTAVLRFSKEIMVPSDNRLKDSLFRNEYYLRITLPLRPANAQAGGMGNMGGMGEQRGLLDRFTFSIPWDGSTNASVVALQDVQALPLGVGVTTASVSGIVSLRGRFTLGSTSTVSVLASPNPVTGGETELTFETSEDDRVSILVTNAMGTVVQTVLEASPTLAGKHLLPVRMNSLQSGTYFIHIRGTNSTATTRVSVLR
jgi:hypothetical protein